MKKKDIQYMIKSQSDIIKIKGIEYALIPKFIIDSILKDYEDK